MPVTSSFTRRALLAAPFVVTAAAKLRAETRPYDVALVLATDVSSSIDEAEHEIQLEGIVSALVHPDMMHLIDDGRRYLFNYMEWSAWHAQRFSGWVPIESHDDALAFASLVQSRPRASAARQTALGQALQAAHVAIAPVKDRAIERVIDIAVDGEDNYEANAFDRDRRARSQAVMRLIADRLAADEVTVNGLVLTERESPMDDETLETYFESFIAGPRSFSVLVPEASHFGSMFLRKLLEEVS
jgi:hypothetical protein